MKRLKQQVSLEGKFEKISITELRSRPGEILAMVELGKVFVITRRGEALAVLSKVPGETLTTTIDTGGHPSYCLT
jgi:prevent-host-death family protein